MATPSKPPPVNPQAPSDTAILLPSAPGEAVTLPPPPAALDGETLDPSRPAAADGTVVAVPGYEIVRELGRGGMGVVYQARHIKLNRPVALKMILAGSHAGAADLARFQTEAEAIARLRHPNIVQVYEVGEHEGKPFFSLEFCGGGSLEKKLNGTPLLPKEAASLVETLARAMQAAHGQKVIHRDLKPANVLLTEDGTPKITDFGLAKKLDEAGQTQSGAVIGTPSYMAPEQAGGKSAEIGPGADVYALGAILYECLTGRPPFKAATALDTIVQVVSDEPVPPAQLQPKTPRDLETICLKCLHKEPARRYVSAVALADDLHRFQNGEVIAARPVGRLERAAKWVRRNRRLAGMAAVLLLTLLTATGVSFVFGIEARWQAKQAKFNEAQAKDRAAQINAQSKEWVTANVTWYHTGGALIFAMDHDKEIEAVHVVQVVGYAMTDNRDPQALILLLRALQLAAVRLRPRDAPLTASTLLSTMQDAKNPLALMYLARGLVAVAARIEPTDAAGDGAAIRIDLDRLPRTDDVNARAALAQAVATLAPRMKSADAERATAKAADALFDSLKEATGPDVPLLTRAWGAVAEWMAPRDLADLLTKHPLPPTAAEAALRELEPLACRHFETIGDAVRWFRDRESEPPRP
jgi:hypothetical protein